MPQNDYFKKAYNIASEGGLEVSPGVFFNNLHNAKYFDKFYTIATEGGLTISKEEFKNRLGIGNEVKYMYEKDGTKVTPEQYFNKRQAPTQPQQTPQAPQFKDPMESALDLFRSSQVKPKFNPIQQPTPQTQTQTEKGAFRLPTEQEIQTFTKTVPDKSSKVLPQGDIIEPVTLANVRSKIDEQLSKGVKDPLANITQYQKEQANNNVQDKYNLEQEGFSKQIQDIQDIDTYSSILEQQLNNQAMGWDNNGGDFMTMFQSSQENLNKNIQTFTAFQTEKQKELEAVNNKFQQASDQYQNGTIDQYQYNAALEEAKASQKNILQEVETKKQQVQAIANEHNKKYSSADIQRLQGLYQLKNDLLVKRYQAIDNPEYADLKAKYSKWDVEQSKADESDKIRQKYLNGELSQEEIKKYTEDGTLQNRNAQAWFARTVGKLTSDILTLPRTFTPNDSYGWTDRLADWANRLNQDITMSNPYSSNLQQSNFQKIAVDPTGQYKVILDDDGEIKSVRLKDGYNAPSFVQEQIKKQYEADKSKFSTPKTEFNEDVLMKNAVNTMTDMGILILGSKGASLALKLGSLGQKLTTGAAIFGQVHNDIYNGAIKQKLNPSKASQLAILTGSGLAMVSYVNPLEYNLASNATRNMVTQADVALINSGKLSVSELSKQYVKGIAKNIVGENLEEVVLEPILTDVLAGSYGMESNEFNPISKKGLETMLITSLVSLPMGVAEVNQELPDYKIQSYKLGAENLIVYNNIMQDKLNKGIITQEEFDTQTEQFAKFAQRYNYTKGQVKENQRDKLVELLVDKSTLENNISTIGDKSLTINEQERLKEVDNELAQLLQQPKVEEQPISEQKEEQPIEPIQQSTPRPKKEEFARKLRERLEREKAKDVKVESAVIEIGGKIYEGKNHAEAILKAKEDGQDISNVNRQEQGKFKLSDGTIIDRSEAKQRFGQDRSELMIEQDKASEQANKDYKKITEASDKVETDIVGKKFKYNNAEWEVLEDRGDKVMVSNGSAKIIVKKDDVLANINPVEKVEQTTSTNQSESNPALRDVESTAKALEGVDKDPITKSISGIPLPPLEIGGYKRKPTEQYNINDPQSISEAYHKAKAKSETARTEQEQELVKAVEGLLGKKEEVKTEKKVEKPAEQKQEQQTEQKQETKPDQKPTIEQQVKTFGVADKLVKPVTEVANALFNGLKKAGLVAKESVEDWLHIGKANKADENSLDGFIEAVKKELPKVEKKESKIQSWVDKWNELKKQKDLKELDLFYNKVKVALNGYAQGKGVEAEFKELKKDIEDYAEKLKHGQNPKVSTTTEFDTNKQPINKLEDLQDVGEKIGGAKKDLAQALSEVTEDDIKSKPLSKVFPRPDFKKLVEEGSLSQDAAILLNFIYDNIPAKPRKAYRLASWTKTVQGALETTQQILEAESAKNTDFVDKIRNAVTLSETLKRDYEIYSETLKGLGFPNEPVNLGGYKIRVFEGRRLDLKTGKREEFNSKIYSIVKDSFIIKDFDTMEEAINGLKSILNNKGTKAEGTKFDIYQSRKTKEYFIGKKGAIDVVRLVDGFKTVKEARDFLKEKQAELQAMWDAMKAPKERRMANRPRVGTDWRKGENITSQKFQETFGFRGVEFGNWVNNAERQAHVNEAYDALMDLASVLGISPKALSLNGELGFAFGARGSGKANAHYESDKVVINLTKTRGAGSLAHEWWHALDNYFSRARNEKDKFITDNPTQKQIFERINGLGVVNKGADESVRREMIDAFKAVMDAIKGTKLSDRSKVLDRTRSEAYWSTPIEMSARSFENYIIEKLGERNQQNDYLANFKETAEWINDTKGDIDALKNYPYPLAEESAVVNEAFQQFFETIKEDENGKLYQQEQAEIADIKANAQYRIQAGKHIIEALQKFNGSPKAVSAIMHEIMHPTVVEIFNGAKDGNAVALKHANTIVSEYNKANPNNQVTLEEMMADNDAFKGGKTTKNYRAVQEFIAESWEKYHYEGKQGFSKAFQGVLDQITEAFKQVYSSLTGKELTPELRKMFDELLGKESLLSKEQTPQEVKAEQPTVSETPTALRDVESTAKRFSDFISGGRLNDISDNFKVKSFDELKSLLADQKEKFDRKTRMGQKDQQLRQVVWDLQELVSAHEKANEHNSKLSQIVTKSATKEAVKSDGLDYVRNKFSQEGGGGKRLSDKESMVLNKEVDKLIDRAEKENGVKRNELKQATWKTNDGYTVTEFFENGRGGTRIITPKGEEINLFNNKYKGESGQDISYFPEAHKSESLLSKEQTPPALRDVESTAKALEGVDKDPITKSISGIPLPPLEIGGYKRKPTEQYNINDPQSISEAYHKAKAKSETARTEQEQELVKAVEELLGKKEEVKAEVKVEKGAKEEVSNWEKEQSDIETDTKLTPEEKEKAKIESTAKALEEVNEVSHKPLEDIGEKLYQPKYVDENTARDVIESFTHYKSGSNKYPATKWARWFQSVDANAKKDIVDDIKNNPELRNSMLSLLYDLYKKEIGFDGSFEDFILTPIKLFRGVTDADKKGKGQEGFSAYSISKNRVSGYAHNRSSNNPEVKEVTVRPIDTYGAVNYIMGAEVEVLFPQNLSKETLQKEFNRLVELNIGEFSENQRKKLEEYYTNDDYIGGVQYAKSIINGSHKTISEAYHKAKAKSETARTEQEQELVKAVEELLAPKEEVTKEEKPKFQTTDKGKFTKLGKETFDKFAKRLKAVFPKIKLNTFTDWKEALGVSQEQLDLMFQVEAWHGSPHDIKDGFKTDKIGTGEGNQAFGWGLYFTELESIARAYAKALTIQIPSFNGKTINVLSLEKKFGKNKISQRTLDLLQRALNSVDGVATKEDLIKYVNENTLVIDKERNESLSLIEGYNDGQNTRKVYKVTLHKGKSPSEYTWLEWNKPLTSKQKEQILNQLEKEGKKDSFTYKKIKSVTNDSDGGEIYNVISEMFEADLSGFARKHMNDSAKRASLFLLRAGIDGIKYPAESIARGTTSDNARGFNYVVFDENAITIEEKIQFLRTPNGTVYGFVKDGQVFINENELNANTLVHEYGHIFAQILKAQYPTAHKNLIDRIKQEKALIEAKKKDQNYAKLTTEQLADEVLNELIGNKGETILNTKKPIHKEILDLLNRFWNRLKNIFTTGSPNIAKWSVEQFQNATIDDIVNNVTADLLSGRKLSNVSSDMLGGKTSFQQQADKQESLDNTQYDYNNPLHNDLNELLNDYISITEEGETSLEDLKDTVGEDLYNTLLSELGENFILSKISPPSIETFEQGVKDAKTSKEKKDLSLVKRGDLTFGEDAKQLFDEMGRKYTPDKWKEIEPKVDEYVQKLLASPNFDEDVENIIKYISDTSTTELTESKGLATAQTMLLNKIAFHAYQMGKKELFKKVFKFSAERGKVFGQAIAAYAEASTPESLLNQAVAIFEGENDQVLNTIQPSGKTMLEELEDVLSKISITAEQVEQVLKQTEAKRKGVTQRARKPRTQPTQTTDKPVSTKQREKANDKIKDAKARLSDWFKENMNIGFAYNPKEEAEKTLKLVSILKDLAIGYLQLGTSNITYIKEQIQKSLGDKIKIDDVWSQVYDDEVSQLHKQNQKDAIINNIVSQFKDGKTSSTKDVSSIIARSLALQAKKISGKKSTQTDMAQRVKELLENKDLARQAWEEALSKAKEEINAKNIPLQEKIDLIHKIEDAIGNFIAIPQSISRKAIRKGMKDVDTTIDDLIKSHFTQKEAKMNDIVKAIVDNTGLSLQDSIEYYDILYKEFNDMLSEKQTKQLEKTLYPKEITRKQKNEVQKMVEAINMGALGTDSFIQAFGEKFGLKKLTEEQVANIKKFTDLMYSTDGEMRRRLAKELSDYIDSLKPMDARNIGRLLNNIVIHHALSGISTIAENIPIGSTLSTITNLLPVIIMNPIRTVRFLGAYNKAGLSGTGTKALADTLRSGYNDMDFFLTEDDMLKKGSRYYNFINKLGFDNPKDFLASVLYKIPMHFAYMASAFDNIINHRGGELLNFIDEYKLASKEVGDVYTKVLERMGYDKASTYSEQVDEEIEDIKALGMKVPIGYKQRRVKELMVAGRNKELQQQAYETIKTYGLMGQPDSILGFIYNHSLKKWGNIKDTDNNLMVAIKTILNITLGMFTRITVAGIEMSLKSTPIFGLMMSAYKYDSKTDKFRATTWEEKKRALAMQAMITGTLIAILAEMFDYDDDELKLNPNRRIDITGSKIPFFDRETLQGEDGFVEPLSFGYRKKDGTMKYVSFAKYIPVFVPLLAFVGNMRDKLEVRDTKQLGKEEFNTNSIKVDASLLLSLITDTFSAQNVASYNTIGSFLTDMVKAQSYHNDNPDIQAEKRREKVNKVLFKTFVSRPGKTLLMPNLYKSVVQLTEYGTDATETMDGVYKNSIKEFYGLDHLVNHEQLDMFGNEVKQPFPIFGLDNEDRYELPEWKMLVDKNITFESPYIGEKATFKGEKVEVSQKDRLILNDKLSIIFGNLVRDNIDELKEMNQMKLLQTLKAYANASEKQLKAMPYKEALKLDVKVER